MAAVVTTRPQRDPDCYPLHAGVTRMVDEATVAMLPCGACMYGYSCCHGSWSWPRATTTCGEQLSSSSSRGSLASVLTHRSWTSSVHRVATVVDEYTRAMLAPRPCTATAAATWAGAGPGPPPGVVSSSAARSAAVGIGSHASVLTSLHHTVRVHDWSTTVPNMCKHSYLGPYFSSSTTRESK